MKPELIAPLIVLLVMMPLVVLRNRAPRVLHPERLWIMPAIVLPMIGLGLWGSQFEPGVSHAPFGLLGWGLLVVGLALGAAFGWQRGRMTTIEKAPDGVLKAQASPLAVMLIIAVFVLRSALRPWTEAHAATWHMSPLAIGDAFLMFAIGMIVAQRIEMYIRAKRIQHRRNRRACGGHPFLKRTLAVLALLIAAAPAAAQDAGASTTADWDLLDEGRSVTAYVAFNEVPSVVIRCNRGAFDVLLINLPAAPIEVGTRILEIGFDDEAPVQTSWIIADPSTTALASAPAFLARRLRRGGALRLIAPGEGEAPSQTYRLPVPPSDRAIDTALRACDQPLEDPRDPLIEAGWRRPDFLPQWSRLPQAQFPRQAAQQGVHRTGVYELLHSAGWPTG